MSLWDFYQQHSGPLIMPLLAISWRGLRVDQAKRAAAIVEYKALEADLTAQLVTVVGRPIDPHSPKQLMAWVYDEHKLGIIKRERKTNKERGATPTLDDDAISELLTRQLPEPVRHALRLISRIRGTHKVLATYLEAPLDPDGRLRCSFNITGTKTGRLSSSENPMGTGTNLQNFPRRGICREMIVPDEGYVFINADLSQAEVRVVAYLAKEERLLRIFEAGGDIHRRNAAAIYGIPEETVTYEQRDIGKKVRHAVNYGMGVNKLARETGLLKAQAQALLHRDANLFPRIKVWHLETEATLRRSRILRTPLGRVRQFLHVWGDELLRDGYSYVPQSTVADLLNDGLVAYEAQRPREILLQIHDSVLVQVRPEQVASASDALRQCLTRPLIINGQTCTIPVDIKTSATSWNDLH